MTVIRSGTEQDRSEHGHFLPEAIELAVSYSLLKPRPVHADEIDEQCIWRAECLVDKSMT